MFVPPSHLPAGAQRDVKDLCVRTLRAVGATTGAAHIEFRVSSSGLKIIEVNGRIGGPSLFVQEVMELTTGVWGPREYLSVIDGGRPDASAPATDGYAGFVSLPVEGQGRIVGFGGEAETWEIPGIVDIKWPMRPGQFVPEGFPRNPSVMFAHVLAARSSYREVVEALESARTTLRLTLDA